MNTDKIKAATKEGRALWRKFEAEEAASAQAPVRNRRASKLVGSDAVVVCGPAKRKAGEPVKCPVCHYYTRIYGACYVCLSVTGRRKKESTTERQPTDNA